MSNPDSHNYYSFVRWLHYSGSKLLLWIEVVTSALIRFREDAPNSKTVCTTVHRQRKLVNFGRASIYSPARTYASAGPTCDSAYVHDNVKEHWAIGGASAPKPPPPASTAYAVTVCSHTIRTKYILYKNFRERQKGDEVRVE